MASNSIFHPLLLQDIYMIAHAQLVYHSFICKSTSSNNESMVLLEVSLLHIYGQFVFIVPVAYAIKISR